MTKPVIENSSFAVQAAKLKHAKQWWDSLSEPQQRAQVKQHRIVTWEHVIKAWEHMLEGRM